MACGNCSLPILRKMRDMGRVIMSAEKTADPWIVATSSGVDTCFESDDITIAMG